MIDLIPFVLIAVAIVLYLLWLLLSTIWDFFVYLWNGLTGETARRKKRQEEARKEEEERQQRQRERQRKRRQAEATERQRFRSENKEVFTGIRHLLSACADPAVEIMRAVGAIEGNSFECDPKLVIWLDVGYILASVRRTGSGVDYIDMLWEEVTRAIKPPNVDGQPSLDVVPKRAVEQLGLVSLLAEYDTQQGTNFTSKAASVYRRIVTGARTEWHRVSAWGNLSNFAQDSPDRAVMHVTYLCNWVEEPFLEELGQ
jgi:hypothetical protein